ncbi:MAG: hypothetical protein Q9191_000391 [Dirinaria sp. TL-2023a]
MATTMDALASFTHLLDNLPSWLSKLDDLSTQITEQHANFLQLTRSTELKLVRQKTGSTESLRPQDKIDAPEDRRDKAVEVTVTSVPPDQPQHHPADQTTVVKEAHRKRKPASALSATSGPIRHRTRSMVIVYYDSVVQEAFESLVRNIAGARNNLRKGRTAASFKSRMTSLGMGSSPFSVGGGRETIDPKMMLRRTKPTASTDSATSAFDVADKNLEKAQTLCESAAHQFLRDGNCVEEIQGTKQSFETCLEVAKKEAKRLRDEKELDPTEEETFGDNGNEINTERPVHDNLSPRVEPPTKPVHFAGFGTIEVDDNTDAESVHIDLSAIRRTTRRT